MLLRTVPPISSSFLGATPGDPTVNRAKKQAKEVKTPVSKDRRLEKSGAKPKPPSQHSSAANHERSANSNTRNRSATGAGPVRKRAPNRKPAVSNAALLDAIEMLTTEVATIRRSLRQANKQIDTLSAKTSASAYSTYVAQCFPASSSLQLRAAVANHGMRAALGFFLHAFWNQGLRDLSYQWDLIMTKQYRRDHVWTNDLTRYVLKTLQAAGLRTVKLIYLHLNPKNLI
jgi:chemotaxis protein histidine kinase CheA